MSLVSSRVMNGACVWCCPSASEGKGFALLSARLGLPLCTLHSPPRRTPHRPTRVSVRGHCGHSALWALMDQPPHDRDRLLSFFICMCCFRLPLRLARTEERPNGSLHLHLHGPAPVCGSEKPFSN